MDKQNRAARKKHHVIYKTTCLVTGKYYIGMHSTDNLADGYMGSGKRLWQSFRKHELHISEILEELPSRDELRKREAELVNEEQLADKQCINLALGGQGGWDYINETMSLDTRKRISILGGKAAGKKYGPTVGLQNIQKWKANPENILNASKLGGQKMKLIGHSQEVKDQIGKINSIRQTGNKNNQFGKIWIHNNQETKCVLQADALKLLNFGWIKGRKLFR